MLVHIGILFCVVVTLANPLPRRYNEDESRKVLYDQKQEGGWNIHADLKNFLFVIIPTVRTVPTNSSGSSTSSTSAIEQGLLYLLSKSANSQRRHHQLPHLGKIDEDTASDEETKHFIESKSAPYQVDISKSSGGLLSRLYPEKSKNEGIFVAKSPTISLLKDPVSGRMARAVFLAIPSEDIVITKADKKGLKKKAREDYLKKGDETRLNCGPGQVKDSYGNCKILKY